MWRGRGTEPAGTKGLSCLAKELGAPTSLPCRLFCKRNTKGTEFTYFTLRFGSGEAGAVGTGGSQRIRWKEGGDASLGGGSSSKGLAQGQEWQEWELVKQKSWELEGNVFGPDFGTFKGKQRSSA